MKPFVIMFILAISMPLWAAEEAKEPAKLTALKTAYEKAVKEALAPIQKKHLEALKALEAEMTKAGQLDGALAVREAVKDMSAATAAEEPVKKLKIVHAEWGNPTSKHSGDVTDILRRMMVDDKLVLPAGGWNKFFGDPAFREYKELTVTYNVGGKNTKTIFKEGEGVHLP